MEWQAVGYLVWGARYVLGRLLGRWCRRLRFRLQRPNPLRLTWFGRWSGWSRWGADGWLVTLTCQGACLLWNNSHQRSCGLEVWRGRKRWCVCGGSCWWRCIVSWCWGAWGRSWVARGCRRTFSLRPLIVARQWNQGQWSWLGPPRWNSIGASQRFATLSWLFWRTRE